MLKSGTADLRNVVRWLLIRYDCEIMSKRELITMQLDRLPEQNLDRLVTFLQSLSEAHAEESMPRLAAESLLAKDWLTPEEDAAWANL